MTLITPNKDGHEPGCRCEWCTMVERIEFADREAAAPAQPSQPRTIIGIKVRQAVAPAHTITITDQWDRPVGTFTASDADALDQVKRILFAGTHTVRDQLLCGEDAGATEMARRHSALVHGDGGYDDV